MQHHTPQRHIRRTAILLVAIPKSASTALMETLATVHDIRCDMHYRWDGPPSEEFPKFHMQHAFGWELSDTAVSDLIQPGILHKTHVLPSRNNLNLLHKRKKVILLRKADGVVEAYKRGQETGVYLQKTKAFESCETLAHWLARARAIGLYQDLVAFRSRWLEAGGDQLIVHYEDLMHDPTHEIARIEAYFDWPASGTTEILKRKYTRLGERSLPYHQDTFERWKKVGHQGHQEP